MKRFTKIFAVIAMAMLVAAPLSAQKKKSSSKPSKMYVGGSIGLTFSSFNDGNGNGERSISSGASYRVMPEFGYNINKKLAVGGQLGLLKGIAAFGSFDPADIKSLTLASASAALDVASDVDSAMPTRITGFRFAPYARYTIFSTSVVDIFVDGMFGFTTISQQSYGPDPNDGTKNIWDGDQYNMIEIAARPGFLLKLSNKFSIIGRLGSAGFQSLKLKKSEAGMTRFGLDMDTSNMLLGFVVNL